MLGESDDELHGFGGNPCWEDSSGLQGKKFCQEGSEEQEEEWAEFGSKGNREHQRAEAALALMKRVRLI